MSLGNELSWKQQQQRQHPSPRKKERYHSGGDEHNDDGSTLRDVIAGLTSFLAVGQFRVAGEIAGDDEIQYRDDEQGADVQRAEAAVNTVRDIKSPLDRLDIKLTNKTPPA